MPSIPDIPGIKGNLKTIFDTANTTTASTDLSNGLAGNKRVLKVLTINPELIPIQPSFFPAMTIWLDRKEIDLQDMAINQAKAQRKATLNLKVAAIVWNNNMQDLTEDDAQDDCEILMENAERIIRDNDTLNNASQVRWNSPDLVTYHTAIFSEEAHLRIGVMDLDVILFY